MKVLQVSMGFKTDPAEENEAIIVVQETNRFHVNDKTCEKDSDALLELFALLPQVTINNFLRKFHDTFKATSFKSESFYCPKK